MALRSKSTATVRKIRSPKVAVIIPMYNEERGADRCVAAVTETIRQQKLSCILIVVNDGSRDQTQSILKKWTKKSLRVRLVTYAKNKGYGGALRSGIERAEQENAEFCLFMDSDLTNDPQYIAAFVKQANPTVDCVKASRYITGGKMVNVPWKRQLISQIGNSIARPLFRMGIHDYTNGFRMARTSLLRRIPYHENGFPIIMEEMYYLKKFGARCVEIPNVLTSRIGNDKTHFSYTPQMFGRYLKYALKAAAL